ncbi:hypothetical protein ZEAMMB73_Zm00001d040523 [Zea mays]|uniref:Uncharacterized protein n=1 Tax=Zea mays TaxID=4577 RepID=A0A1D6MR66_MAIZE|nr:hypothetical protein ZEAMMB73_Zm00001d040523 [Zea mays]
MLRPFLDADATITSVSRNYSSSLGCLTSALPLRMRVSNNSLLLLRKRSESLIRFVIFRTTYAQAFGTSGWIPSFRLLRTREPRQSELNKNHFGANIVVTRGPLSCRDGSYPPYYAANITSRYFFYCKNPQCRLQAKHKGITSQIEIENLSMLKTKNVKVKDIDVCGTLGACFLCSQT